MRRTIRLLPLLALAAVPFAHAAEGAYEINQDCVAVGCFPGDNANFPVTISQPGIYLLTSDLAPPGDALTSAITVFTGDVEIDLNGHTIDGGGACAGTPVTSCAGAAGYLGIKFSNNGSPGAFRVHDGTIRGFSNGAIGMTDAGDGTAIERVTVLENASTLAMAIDGNTSYATVRLRSLQVARNAGYGVGYASTQPRLVIEDSTFSGNKFAGAQLSTGAVFTGNHFVRNGGVGIICSATCALGQNTFEFNNTSGASAQWTIPTVRDMGGNVCLDDGTCP